MTVIPCDYNHVTDESDIDDTAAWVYVGEAGDYYLCEHHFKRRTDKRGWTHIEQGA